MVMRVFNGSVRAITETAFLGAMTIAIVAQPMLAATGSKARVNQQAAADPQKWSAPMPEEEKALHLVDRITFGPRPGDLERVRQMGLGAFLDQQLHAERLDDSAVEARVAALPSLSMSAKNWLRTTRLRSKLARDPIRSLGAPRL